MPNEDSQRNIKYIRRKKKLKTSSSVRSLVTQITEIPENLDENFDTTYKEVQRIVKTMQTFSGNTGKLKVASETEQGMVFLTKHFLPKGSARDLYEKIRSDEELSEEEQTRLTDLFKEAVKLNADSPENELLLRATQAEEEFMSLMDEIREIITKDIGLADKIINSEVKVQFLREYRDHLTQRLDTWRNEVSSTCIRESLHLKLVEIGLERGYSLGELHLDMNPEILNELMEILIHRDSSELIGSFEDE